METKLKHTPGPWHYEQELDEALHIHSGDRPEVIATIICEPIQPECIADAKLIAAAPDLLSACLIAYVSAPANVQRILSDAILKATGTTR